MYLNTVTFESQNCATHCNDAPITVQGVTHEPLATAYSSDGVVFRWQIEQPPQPVSRRIVMLNESFFF